MIALVATLGAVLITSWMLTMISWWLAMFWIMWVVTGVTWFVMNLGNKSSPDRWYDRVLLAPVLPLAWMFGMTARLCEKIDRKTQMARDPKTGYHWIWLTPIMFVLLALSAGAHKITQLFVRLRSAYVSWRNPEIARMKKLAGMHK